MSNDEQKETVLRELNRLRQTSARSWVLNATPEMIEEFISRKGCGYSQDMCEAIMAELERASVEAA
jgi:hypothetical protein